jgi:hypothetical protein
MRLMRQQNQPGGAAVAADGLIQLAGLQRSRPRVGVFRPVDD